MDIPTNRERDSTLVERKNVSQKCAVAFTMMVVMMLVASVLCLTTHHDETHHDSLLENTVGRVRRHLQEGLPLVTLALDDCHKNKNKKASQNTPLIESSNSNALFPMIPRNGNRNNNNNNNSTAVCPAVSSRLQGTSCTTLGQSCNYGYLCYQVVDPATRQCVNANEQKGYQVSCTCRNNDEDALALDCIYARLPAGAMPCGNPYCAKAVSVVVAPITSSSTSESTNTASETSSSGGTGVKPTNGVTGSLSLGQGNAPSGSTFGIPGTPVGMTFKPPTPQPISMSTPTITTTTSVAGTPSIINNNVPGIPGRSGTLGIPGISGTLGLPVGGYGIPAIPGGSMRTVSSHTKNP
jgi:hypothetical protein